MALNARTVALKSRKCGYTHRNSGLFGSGMFIGLMDFIQSCYFFGALSDNVVGKFVGSSEYSFTLFFICFVFFGIIGFAYVIIDFIS